MLDMNTLYTDEKAVQIVIALLKAHGIKKVIASPGGTNISFVASIQNDPWFEIYSSVDERSAAYMACGLADESGEIVVISCTGATASRNYVPGLTEAYYRKLPIIALTSSQMVCKVGHLAPQVIDRSVVQKDIVRYSTLLPFVNSNEDQWSCEIKVNEAILETRRNGGGPVHIDLQTTYKSNYNVATLPSCRKISRYTLEDKLPKMDDCKIAIVMGSHYKLSSQETNAIDSFCESRNAVVYCDHTSGYYGKFALHSALAFSQSNLSNDSVDLLLHLGEVSGDYHTMAIKSKMTWRISPDGEIRDLFRNLTSVFQMSLLSFFTSYTLDGQKNNSYYTERRQYLDNLRLELPDVPFSNIWVAGKLSKLIPQNSVIHFGILNSLRSWNLFDLPKSVTSSSNVGGFGIEGCMSSLIGASLNDPKKLYYLVLGDLAFFYDLNAIGNRHIGTNVRILIVNNGKGVEFRNIGHPASFLGETADEYVAAAGHFGNKSKQLVRDIASDLGYKYISASNKEEFDTVYKEFVKDGASDKSIVFEVFTETEDERIALNLSKEIRSDVKGKMISAVKNVLGTKGVESIKKILK